MIEYNKITEAYIAGKIDPFHKDSCFVGQIAWNEGIKNWSTEKFSMEELLEVEEVFMKTISLETGHSGANHLSSINHPNYKNALFNAVSNALDKLETFKKETIC